MNLARHDIPKALVAQIAAQGGKPVPGLFTPLVPAMQARFGGSLAAVLLYGSCLRDVGVSEGVVDLYALVHDYSRAYGQRYLRLLNACLPPNVFYAEVPGPALTLRVKYAVISLHDFETGVGEWFHPYLWGRFAQPVRLICACDDTARSRVHAALATAVVTFLEQTVPVLDADTVSVETLWTAGLQRSYAAELRPERERQPGALVRWAVEDYARLTECALPVLRHCLERVPDGGFRRASSHRDIRRALWCWRLRRWQGRILSILRLAKATLTFRGGIDYAAWKIERHSGVRIDISPGMRRHPLLGGWKALWELLRRGALR